MKITRISSYPVTIPLKPERRMISSLGQHTVSRYLLVRIETDAGIEGAGEATVMPRWSGETVWGAQAMVDRVLAPPLIGCDPTHIEGLADLMDQQTVGNWFAKSALEMACWDIRGKAEGKPVYELLGGPVRGLSLTCRFSMGAYPPERARKRAAELVAEGFQTIKIKVTSDIPASVERVAIVREVIGPDRAIVIDANCGYRTAAEAIEAARQMEPYHVGLFEQPTPRGDFEALAEVRRNVQPEVMADDCCFDLIDAVNCVREEAVDVISVYPGKNGGILRSKQLIELAAAHGVACSIGSNLEWDVATAAMGHVAIGCPGVQLEKYPGDILGPEYHEFRIVKQPLDISGPVIMLTDRPGLGVEVDWNMVNAHLCRD